LDVGRATLTRQGSTPGAGLLAAQDAEGTSIFGVAGMADGMPVVGHRRPCLLRLMLFPPLLYVECAALHRFSSETQSRPLVFEVIQVDPTPGKPSTFIEEALDPVLEELVLSFDEFRRRLDNRTFARSIKI